MSHPLQCECGKLKGVVDHPEKAMRAVCYCKDCQAFAHYLGKQDSVLDPMGGTDVVAVHPREVRFTEGRELLACMSLSDKGMLRWYASCCNSPIGNTSRSVKLAHVGLIHSCLESGPGALERAFGPVRMRSATKSAHGTPPEVPFGAVKLLPRFAVGLLVARISGSFRRTPFFKEDGTPAAAPTVLDSEQRARLMAAVG